MMEMLDRRNVIAMGAFSYSVCVCVCGVTRALLGSKNSSHISATTGPSLLFLSISLPYIAGGI